MARNPKSIGEIISTFTFFGVAVACVFQALEFYESEQHLRSYASVFAGLLCTLGGLRFFIADMMKVIQERFRK